MNRTLKGDARYGVRQQCAACLRWLYWSLGHFRIVGYLDDGGTPYYDSVCRDCRATPMRGVDIDAIHYKLGAVKKKPEAA